MHLYFLHALTLELAQRGLLLCMKTCCLEALMSSADGFCCRLQNWILWQAWQLDMGSRWVSSKACTLSLKEWTFAVCQA